MRKVMLCLMVLLVATPLALAEVAKLSPVSSVLIRLSDNNSQTGGYLWNGNGFRMYYLFDLSGQISEDNESAANMVVRNVWWYGTTLRIDDSVTPTNFLDAVYAVPDTSWSYVQPYPNYMNAPALGDMLLTFQAPFTAPGPTWGGPYLNSAALTAHVQNMLTAGGWKVAIAIEKYDHLDNATLADEFWSAGNAFLYVDYEPKVTKPVIVNGGELYTTPSTVTVTITDADSNAIIRYTTDGTDPVPTSAQYTGAFTINKTTVVKAKAWRPGYRRSEIASQQFVYNGNHIGKYTDRVIPTDETYVADSYPGPNWSDWQSAIMVVGNMQWVAPNVRDLIKFNIPEVQKPTNGRTIVNWAILCIGGGDAPVVYDPRLPTATLYGVDNNTWTEQTATWTNPSSIGAPISTFYYRGIVYTYGATYVDVTNFIQAKVDNGTTQFSFAIDAPNWWVNASNPYYFRLYTKAYYAYYGPFLMVDYTLPSPPVDNLTITPSGVNYYTNFPKAVTVTIGGGIGATDNATIRYTTNGTEPLDNSTIYTAPLSFTILDNSTPVVVKAKGFVNGYGGTPMVSTELWPGTHVGTIDDVKENFESYAYGALLPQNKGWYWWGVAGWDGNIVLGANGTKVQEVWTGANQLYNQGYQGSTTGDLDTYAYESGISFEAVPTMAYFSAQIRPYQYPDVHNVLTITPNQIGAQCFTNYPGVLIGVDRLFDDGSSLADMGRFQIDSSNWAPASTTRSEGVQMFDNVTHEGYIWDIGLQLTARSSSDISETLYYRNATLGGDWIKSSIIDNVIFYNYWDVSTPRRTYLRGYLAHTQSDNLRMGQGVMFADPLALSPAGADSFTTVQTVTITGCPAGSTIHYTTNGNNPKVSDTLYTGPVRIGTTTTLKAQAFLADGFATSQMGQGQYNGSVPMVATPVISPAGGNFATAQSVTITCATSGAIIRYTTDGSEPDNTTSALYSGPLTINSNCMLKAIGFAPAGSSLFYSLTATASFSFLPVISPAGGTFDTAVTVSIAYATPGAAIRYTLNGSDPDNSSTLYTGPFSVSPGATVSFVKAMAVTATGQSATATAAFDSPADAKIGPVLDSSPIPYGTATVDGNLSDWSGATWRQLHSVYDNTTLYGDAYLLNDVPEAYYAARWTPNKIYVAVKVLDNSKWFTDNYTEWNARDAIEIYLHTSGYSASTAFASSEEAQQYAIGVKNSNRNAVWTDLGYKKDPPAIVNFQAAGSEGGDGWLYYEFAMTPFTYMGAFVSAPSVQSPVVSGQLIGFDIAVVDNNGPDYVGMLAESPSNEYKNKSNGYSQFGLHRLTGNVPIPGDVNGDGVVNSADLAIVLAAMDSKPPSDPRADLDGDGEVTSTDLSIVLAHM